MRNFKIKTLVNRIFNYFGYRMYSNKNIPFYFGIKYKAEIDFWKGILISYEEWFEGKLSLLYGETCPNASTKVVSFDKRYSAILTWLDVHQKAKYLDDLLLEKDVFDGLRILDIGSGPIPSASVFSNCELYCLDPLMPLYMEAGFPIHIYENRIKFVFGFSEKMPFPNGYFDSIISVNAIDHVDDFIMTANEIKRVLKPGGKMRFHIHYHAKTVTEPLELNDDVVSAAFSWAKGFKKISESKQKRGSVVEDSSELYTLWSNF